MTAYFDGPRITAMAGYLGTTTLEIHVFSRIPNSVAEGTGLWL